MAKKRFASSAQGSRAAKSARRVGRPSTGYAKQLIALRVSPTVLAKIRKMADRAGKPYQTYIHEILEKLTKMGA